MGFFSGFGGLGRIKINVVRNHKIEKAVVIEINESATGTPAALRIRETAFYAFLAKRAVAQVVIKGIRSPFCYEEIDMPAVLYVSGANSLSPTRTMKAGLRRDIFEFEITQIVIKVVDRLRPVKPTTI